MPFSEIFNDSITIRKKNGTANGPHMASVQGDKVYLINDDELDVDDGDTLERVLPNNKIEVYTILEAVFNKGLHSIPDQWKLLIRKNTSLRTHGERVTNINIEQANAIQIGDHNIQEISSVLQSLVDAIDKSDVAPEQKEEVKSRLATFLKHPIVTAILGASAGAIIKSVLGE